MLCMILLIHNYLTQLEQNNIKVRIRLPHCLKIKKINKLNRYDSFEKKESTTTMAIDKLFSQDMKNALIDYVNTNIDNTNLKNEEIVQSYNDFNSSYYTF